MSPVTVSIPHTGTQNGDPNSNDREPGFVPAGSLVMRYDESNSEIFAFPHDRWSVDQDSTLWSGGSTARHLGRAAALLNGEDADDDVESFRLKGYGGSISLYGTAPIDQPRRKMKVSIRGAPPIEVDLLPPSATDPLAPSNTSSPASTYRKWFDSPLQGAVDLQEGPIEVIFYNVPVGASVDFAEMAFSPLSDKWRGSKMVCDDSDANIQYTGSWSIESAPPVSTDGWAIGSLEMEGGDAKDHLMGQAYGGSVHVGRRVGDTLTMNFIGRGATLWGFLDKTQEGYIDVAYSFDGGPQAIRTYGPSPEGVVPSGNSVLSQPTSSGRPHFQQHFKLFSTERFWDGPHSLTLTITNITSTSPSPNPNYAPALYVDYITFENKWSPPAVDRALRTGEVEYSGHSVGIMLVLPVVLCIAGGLMFLFWCLRIKIYTLFGAPFQRRSGRRRQRGAVGKEDEEMARREQRVKDARLDLEFSCHAARCPTYLEATVVEATMGSSAASSASSSETAGARSSTSQSPLPPVYTFYPEQHHSSEQSPCPPTAPPAPSSDEGTLRQRRASSDSAAELVGLVAYLSGVRKRLRAVVGVDWGRSWGTWTGTWARTWSFGRGTAAGSRSGTDDVLPPPYDSNRPTGGL